MNFLTHFYYRVKFKILRTLPFTQKIHLKILSGDLKGYKFIAVSTNDYLLGTYESNTLNSIKKDINSDSVIYDIGANFGYYSMIFAQQTKQNVIAFEPIPDNIKIFKNHLDINEVKNVTVLPFAIADCDKEVEFSNEFNNQGNTYVEDSPLYQKITNKIKINCRSVDSIVSEKLAPPPTFMKIDVEGAEYDALLGSVETIKKYKPTILLATHELHVPGIKDKCLNFLNTLGYTTCEMKNEGFDIKGLEDFYAIPNN
jgi:FkbM family methyltransferase